MPHTSMPPGRSSASSRTTRWGSTTSTSTRRASGEWSSRNTPGVLTNATAEHAIGLVLALLRRICEGDRSLRRRDEWEWGPDFMIGEGLEGKELLVVGPGRIGRRVAELAEALGARVRFAGRSDDLVAAARERGRRQPALPADTWTRAISWTRRRSGR